MVNASEPPCGVLWSGPIAIGSLAGWKWTRLTWEAWRKAPRAGGVEEFEHGGAGLQPERGQHIVRSNGHRRCVL